MDQNTQNSMEPRPNNLLVWSILATVLCCVPFGIPAILNSTKVDMLWDRGDKAGAYEAARKAQTFCWISLVLGLIIAVVYVVLIVAGVIDDSYVY